MVKSSMLTVKYGESVTENYTFDNNLTLFENVKKLQKRFPELGKKPDENVYFDSVQLPVTRGLIDSKHSNNETILLPFKIGLRKYTNGQFGFYVRIGLHPYSDEMQDEYEVGGTLHHVAIQDSRGDFVQDESCDFHDGEFVFYNFAIWLHLLKQEGDEIWFDDCRMSKVRFNGNWLFKTFTNQRDIMWQL